MITVLIQAIANENKQWLDFIGAMTGNQRKINVDLTTADEFWLCVCVCERVMTLRFILHQVKFTMKTEKDQLQSIRDTTDLISSLTLYHCSYCHGNSQ